MVQAGVPIKVVSQRLGHTTVQMTLDRYTHVLPAMDEDAVERYAALVDGSGDGGRLGTVEGWQPLAFYVSDAMRAQIELAASDANEAVGDFLRDAVLERLA